MSDILDSLKNLSAEELEKIGGIINALASSKKEDTKETEKSTKKPKKPQKDVSANVVEQTPQKGRKEPRKKQGRVEPRNPRNQRTNRKGVRKKGGTGGVAARTEPVRLSGENKFESMRERNDFKNDSEIDKKLWSGRAASQRPQQFNYAEVQCNECGLWFDIHPSLVYIDPDTKDYKFTCDSCTPKGH